MRPLGILLGLGCAALLCPPGARAEPIGVSTSGGAQPVIDLGTITLDGGFALIPLDGLSARDDYAVKFKLTDLKGSGITSVTVELLDPLSDGFDADDPAQPLYVPVGFSTSNNSDGLSFAWNSGLERSARFANGGTASLRVDEDTDAHDMLVFHGFGNGNSANIRFGVRDNLGDRGFLLRVSVDGQGNVSQNPEPASLLLLATGVAGLARFARRRPEAA